MSRGASPWGFDFLTFRVIEKFKHWFIVDQCRQVSPGGVRCTRRPHRDPCHWVSDGGGTVMDEWGQCPYQESA